PQDDSVADNFFERGKMGCRHPVIVALAHLFLGAVEALQQPETVANVSLMVIEEAEFPDVSSIVVFENTDNLRGHLREDIERRCPQRQLVGGEPKIFESEGSRRDPFIEQRTDPQSSLSGIVVTASDHQVPP